MSDAPVLIAHRGEHVDFPENTVPALLGAVEAGAEGVEFDVQFLGDGTPAVIHDPDLRRTGGDSRRLRQLDGDDLAAGLPAGEPERFGSRYEDVRVPSLDDVVAALVDTPASHIFAEIKDETLAHNDVPRGVQAVIEACRPLGERCIVIGFDESILRTARSLGAPGIGWAVRRLDEWHAERAGVLKPDFVFADEALFGATSIRPWDGPWRWVLYEINDAETTWRFAKAGIWGIETASVARLKAALAEGN